MAILDDIYEAVTDDAAFGNLPLAIAAHVGARSCSMLAYDERRMITRTSANHFTDEMYAFQQDPEVAALDVWTAVGARRDRLGFVSNTADYWDISAFKLTPYFNECIRAFGDDTVHCMGGIVRSEEGYLALAAHAGDPTPPFVQRDAAALTALMPHVFRMMNLRARFGATTATQDLLQHALDQMPDGVLAVDRHLRVRAANRSALALLTVADGLRSVSGRLVAVDDRVQDRFASAIRAAVTWSHGRGDAILIPRLGGGAAYRVLVTPIKSPQAVALVIVEDPDDRDPGFAASLSQMFGLTGSEAQVAVLLAEGLTPEEAAEARAVKLNTVRTQIKSLLGKTEARRLSDLVRLLARTPRRPT